MHSVFVATTLLVLCFESFSCHSIYNREVKDIEDALEDEIEDRSLIPDLLPKSKKEVCEIKLCDVKFIQNENRPECIMKREVFLKKAKFFYKITSEAERKERKAKGEKDIKYPLLKVPWLDQTVEILKGYFSSDDFEARYLAMFGFLRGVLEKSRASIQAVFQGKQLNIETYKQIYLNFGAAVNSVHSNILTNPCFHNECYDHIKLGSWKEDDAFVQRRLAGPCPYLIQKVFKSGNAGFLESELNKEMVKDFDYDVALSSVVGYEITLRNAIDQGLLYVSFHPQHKAVKAVNLPLFKHEDKSRVLNAIKTPITLFILNKDGLLKLASIQLDAKLDSQVLSPATTTPDRWLKARGIVEQSDIDMCQAKYHMGHIHTEYTVYCISLRRNFDQFHPLYDFFKYHCEGTIPHITLTHQALTLPHGLTDEAAAMTHKGFLQLGVIGYNERQYGKFDLPSFMAGRGLDDPRIKYYPFRDDAEVLWKEYKTFSDKFINLYYSSDAAVSNDKQLQNFAAEMSMKGLGKMKGFPESITSSVDLKTFIIRFLWYNIFHTTVNYPMNMFSESIVPFKMYHHTDPTICLKYEDSLPDVNTTVGAAFFTQNLANLRVNRIFDYYDKIQDPKFRELIRGTYEHLNSCVQKTLGDRNKARRANKQMGFEYFEPKWLTNSIHV